MKKNNTTRITLPWMNTIRQMRAAHKTPKEIVNKLFKDGLLEERQVEQRFNTSAKKAAQMALLQKRELEKFSFEVRELWPKMGLSDGQTKVPVEMMPLGNSVKVRQ